MLLSCTIFVSYGLLYPQDSETRDIRDLSGLWWFVAEPKNTPGFGFSSQWWNTSLASFEVCLAHL